MKNMKKLVVAGLFCLFFTSCYNANGRPGEEATANKQITRPEYKVLTGFDKVVLVDVGADWCAPCKRMEPVLDELKKELGEHFKLVKIDSDVHTDIVKYLNAETIPTFIIYKNGLETWRKQGIVSLQELKARL
jgi:thioredoxin-like negative regulator of GroEL